jgi:hypothetical protein
MGRLVRFVRLSRLSVGMDGIGIPYMSTDSRLLGTTHTNRRIYALLLPDVGLLAIPKYVEL